jgi:hypothetical protein
VSFATQEYEYNHIQQRLSSAPIKLPRTSFTPV